MYEISFFIISGILLLSPFVFFITDNIKIKKKKNMKVDINEVCEWLDTHLYNHYEKYQKGPYVASNCHESVERLISEFRRSIIKKEYPKCYEECCEVLEKEYRPDVTYGYRSDLLHNFQILIFCRDAYWKLYGEEIGLDKPWEPDWKDEHQGKWVITMDLGHIVTGCVFSKNHILAFPTEEMRNAFYEYFKEKIEICKELL